jgi:NAD(P)-dependent dehydrogenase (short-subunit alcohol dehydrogenase family)
MERLDRYPGPHDATDRGRRATPEMQEIAGELQASHGVQALAVEMDVTSTEAIDAAMSLVSREFGKLDFL